MHVTAHALCGRHGAAELMADGMTLFVLRDRLVPGARQTGVPVLGPRSGVERIDRSHRRRGMPEQPLER